MSKKDGDIFVSVQPKSPFLLPTKLNFPLTNQNCIDICITWPFIFPSLIVPVKQ